MEANVRVLGIDAQMYPLGGRDTVMSPRLGCHVRRKMESLDPRTDAHDIARLSVVTLHGHTALVYTLFTIAFMEQVAIPSMARTLYRRGTGDIVAATAQRNADTLLFFGQLLDHGPTSAVGRMWIDRLNDIHSHFPLRNDDSLYTLATLALDPHRLTSTLGRSPFSDAELEAQWRFWRDVAVLQHVDHIPSSRDELASWRDDYERREFAATHDGRQIARALIGAFAEQVLPTWCRGLATEIISALCSPQLRAVHDLPAPRTVTRLVLRGAMVGYSLSTPLHPVDLDRSLVTAFGTATSTPHDPASVGYLRPSPRSR